MTDELTQRFYEDNADAFFAQTVEVDMRPVYERFLRLVPSGGHILDAGCGSGRDAKAFGALGYQVAAFDASPALAAKASALLGQEVHVRRFDEIDFVDTFDAVWACASLLHVQPDALTPAIDRLAIALHTGGILYASFKLGNGHRRDRNGRHFTDLDPSGLMHYLSASPELSLIETWESGDQRPGRDSESWLNVLLEKR